MAKLSFENGAFIYRCEKHQRHPAKESEWRFDSTAGWKDPHWGTRYYDKVALLIVRCREEKIELEIHITAKQEIRRLENEKKTKIARSRKTESSFEVPVPDGLEYFPFQKAGIEYAVNTNNTLIADEMGLGKTIQAIGAINYTKPKKVLIIVPASLKLNWERELKIWLVDEYSICVAGRDRFDINADIIVINYERLVMHQEKLLEQKFDLLIVDESHYVKNHKAKRTKAVVKIARRTKRRIFLTGTPILNRPIELFTPLCILRSDIVQMGWYEYVRHFCAGQPTHWGWDVSGHSNTKELNEKLRSTIMVRRLKKDVLTELPAKTRSLILLDSKRTGIKEALKNENRVKAKWDALKISFEIDADNEEQFRNEVKALGGSVMQAFEEISIVRHETALAKVPEAIDFIKNALELQEKVVVFTHHKDVLENIYQEFKGKSVKVTGDVSLSAREEAIQRFQEDKQIQLFLGTTQAAGLGITLTASSVVIFIELEWTPSGMSQAEDRCHRIGQEDAVNIYHLVVDGSIDSELSKVLVGKQEVIEAILDVEHEIDRANLTDVKKAKGKRPSMALSKLTKRISEEDCKKIHEALQYLASKCDGAITEDGQGFNKFDTTVGKQLAAQESLSSRQAAFGYIIAKKYRRQLPDELIVKI